MCKQVYLLHVIPLVAYSMFAECVGRRGLYEALQYFFVLQVSCRCTKIYLQGRTREETVSWFKSIGEAIE